MKSWIQKVIAASVAGILAVSLFGCSGNPMQSRTPEQNAAFLIKASEYAEKELGYSSFSAGVGNKYFNCMSQKLSEYKECKDIYKYMIVFAKKDNVYKHLKVSEINDYEYFEKIKEDYNKLMMIEEKKQLRGEI